MLRKVSRLFTIKTRFEAFLLIYALALGATTRGAHYLVQFPGWGGYLLFFACTGAVFLAGARLLELTRKDIGDRRRKSDILKPSQELA